MLCVTAQISSLQRPPTLPIHSTIPGTVLYYHSIKTIGNTVLYEISFLFLFYYLTFHRALSLRPLLFSIRLESIFSAFIVCMCVELNLKRNGES